MEAKKYPTRQFLDFESKIAPLYKKLVTLDTEENNKDAKKQKEIQELNTQIATLRKGIASKLNNWQRVQLSRHPNRPYARKYIDLIFTDFVELAGDRCFKDDKAAIGGFASLDGQTVMVIGQQKGYSTKTRQLHNFGMMYPEGYRKALRLFKLAEKFKKPIVCFIDTPGAFPGVDAENRGQGQAIAQNIIAMMGLNVPIICVIIGEGASGGALGIAVGDRTLMLEHTWFTVISPESCSSILWKNWDSKEIAAKELKLSSKEMLNMKLIDGVIKEPLGGAHWDYKASAQAVKKHLIENLKVLKKVSGKKLIAKRIKHYRTIGIFDEK